MALVVQHNLTAMNANRQLGMISGAQAKATEKLSSGYQINRAGDDAAGLTISEKMRSQINGLNKASKNAQDGVSLIQSAEGALNEAHSILQRMNELAVQGANDTNQNIDRDAINQELEALTAELDRISDTTQFNKQNLLDGSFKNKNLHVGANTNQKIVISINAMNASALGLGKVSRPTSIVVGTVVKAEAGKSAVIGQVSGQKVGDLLFSTKSFEGMNSAISYAAGIKASGAGVTSGQIKWAVSTDGVTQKYVISNRSFATFASAYTSAKVIVASRYKTALKNASAEIRSTGKLGLTVSGGSKWGMIKSADAVASVQAQSTRWSLGTPTSGYAARVDDYKMANQTISRVQEAINIVSKQRSALGALQNRLEHTIANLDTVSENTAAAESRIRDTDMASQMVEYSKNNILAQAGQSMLAQANQSTQGVLSLLG